MKLLEIHDHWRGLDLHHEELVQAVNAVRAWYNGGLRGALVLAGCNGAGKSHIAREVQRAYGPGTVFWSEPRLITALWASYDGDGSERALLARCRNARLLVLDDLGADTRVKAQGWLESIYWQLFDYHPTRPPNGLLITTNRPWHQPGPPARLPFLERVGQRAASRLIGLLGGLTQGRPMRWVGMWNTGDYRNRVF